MLPLNWGGDTGQNLADGQVWSRSLEGNPGAGCERGVQMLGKVLVVDDDDDLAGLLTTRLRKVDLNVERAGNGSTGVELTRSFQPDVILLDWMMPVKSGIEACEEIRADSRLNQPHIILLSAKNGPDDVARAREAGVNEYITKPFAPIALIDHVRDIIEGRLAS